MKHLFADTFYWIASINPGDDWHHRVRAFTATLNQVQIVTTDEVLTEVLTFFAGRGIKMRQRAVQLVKGVMANPKILVLQQTRDSFLAGVQLYENRPDKEYSLTDCVSMNVIRKFNIREILTHFKVCWVRLASPTQRKIPSHPLQLRQIIWVNAERSHILC